MAYLTHSQYGRNGNEVTINNNDNIITGIAGNTVWASRTSSTANSYNTSKGMLASTTGNIYGVYDMSGGAFEYTAGWNPKASDLQYGKAVDGKEYFGIDEINDKTKTVYRNVTETNSGETVKKICRTGDGIKETWILDGYSWFNDSSYFVNINIPFSLRGGTYNNEKNAGLFFSGYNNGKADPVGFNSYSFRLILTCN